MIKANTLYGLIAVLLITLSGCIKDKYEIAKGGGFSLYPNTIIANDITNTQLIQVTPTQLIYQNNTSQLAEVKQGDIIVSGITDKAPYGYLRKVISVTQNGNQTILSTEYAKLDEAIKSCHIEYRRKFAASDTLPGKTDETADLEFGNEMNLILYDKDGDTSTTHDQVKVYGAYKLDPDFLFNLDIDNGLEYVRLGFASREQVELNVEAALVNSPVLKPEISFPPYKLTPFTIWVGPCPFCIPIVVVPELKFKIGAEAEMYATVKAGFNGEFVQQAYVDWQKGRGWGTFHEQNYQPTVTQHSIEGTAELEGYVKAELSFSFYDISGLESSIDAKVYAKAEGTCNITPAGFDDCNFNIKGGISSTAEVNVNLFSHQLVDYSVDIFDLNTVIYSYGQDDTRTSFGLSNGNYSFYNINGCVLTASQDTGSHNDIYFDVDYNIFNPYQFFEVRNTYVMENGLTGNNYYDSNDPSVTIVDYNTIKLGYCTRFSASQYADMTFVILNDSYVSSPITVRVYRQPGCYKKEDDSFAIVVPSN